MADFKQECKLCDNIISDKNFKVIDEVAKDIFDTLLLESTLDGTQNVMCITCSSKLIAALNFKSKCLYTDNTIIPYVDFKNPKPIDLKQIYAKVKGSKQRGSLLDDQEVCRLCLQPMSGDHKSLQDMPVGIIEKYIPEINFEVTTNPKVCIKCHDALYAHSTFVKSCLDVVKKRNRDAKIAKIFVNDQFLKMEEIEIKSEETDEEILLDTVCDITKETHDERDTPLQPQIDLMHTEESKSLYDIDDLEQTSAPSTLENDQPEKCSFAGLERRHKRASEAQANKSDCSNRNSKRHYSKIQEYQCDKCTFKTKYKHCFMQHQLNHKDPAEVQMYECDECPYRSIQKRYLKKHQLTHKDPLEVGAFLCDECDYETIYKQNLLIHQLKHRDRPEVFKCDECDYKSIGKGSLKQHQLRHKDRSGVRVFQCDECDFKSIREGFLKQHQLRHISRSESAKKKLKSDLQENLRSILGNNSRETQSENVQRQVHI